MTKSYVVSGTGVRYMDEHFCVPNHVEIHFYRARRRAPQIYKPRGILEQLMVEVGVFPDWIATPGDFVPIHHCWSNSADRPESGVFRRSTGQLVIDLRGTALSKPIDLAYIVERLAHGRDARMTVIHWLVRTGEFDGVCERPVNCLRPPRLRGGDSQEGEESRRAPLSISFEAAVPSDRADLYARVGATP
jgi:hypothetical protein